MHITYPPPYWKQIIPRALVAFLLRTVRVDTAGSEAGIPVNRAFVCAFAPHCGWIDSIVIDGCFLEVGRPWPFWLTKGENRTLPEVIKGDRVICMDQSCPELSAVRAVHALLRLPNAVLATSFEGTRSGNPDDPTDLRTLGAFKPGSARFALQARVPVLPVVVLGGERVIPHLDTLWERERSRAALRRIREAMAHPQDIVVRFLPLYREHLREPKGLRGRRLGERAAAHTAALRALIVEAIRQLDPSYPIGA